MKFFPGINFPKISSQGKYPTVITKDSQLEYADNVNIKLLITTINSY